ncbi:MAG: DUF1295 domain-containing protein, partial [Nocardioidaceae bacterium]
MRSAAFAGQEFAASLPWSAAAVVVVLALTYFAAQRAGRHNVIDSAWGVLFCAAAIVAFWRSAGQGDDARRWLLLFMTLLWGIRLAVHITRRGRGKGEDPRYQNLLAGRGALQTILMVYLLQGVLAYLISAPVQVGMFEPGPLTPVALLGIVLWLVGIAFEAVGDRQLERFKADPDHGLVLDTGLWRYTRHPNYFGDACVWVGIFCVAAGHWPGLLTVISPLIMVYLLAFGSGKRVLERSMAQRPGYRDYMEHTSG